MESASGVVTSLQICPGHGVPMQPVDPAVFTADLGLQGCRHARAGSRRQVLLIEEETLDRLGLEPGQVRENVTTRGIDLSPLPVDTRLIVGDDVELWITGPCQPCALLDEIRSGLQAELQGRRGVLAWVKRGGQVRVGDRIRALPVRQAADEQEDS
ncbi:MAG: MOSC domain-containing protein [Gemmatimonadota bacterium]|nr:MAG: MOSC domain-containing protein [Gemmatimonadota bacterium]